MSESLIQAWLNTPVRPKKTNKVVPEQRRCDALTCTHEYIPLPGKDNQSFCPKCGKSDFRRLKCRHCERPQTDTGTCKGH